MEAIGDGVRSTDGWVAAEGRGGWLSAGSKGGARSSFRGTVALGDRGWLAVARGTGHSGRERVGRTVHAGEERGEGAARSGWFEWSRRPGG